MTFLSQALEAVFLVLRDFFWSLVKDLEMPLFYLRASALFYLLASLVYLWAFLTASALGFNLFMNFWFFKGFLTCIS